MSTDAPGPSDTTIAIAATARATRATASVRLMRLARRAGDRAPAQHQLAVHQAGELPGRGTVGRILELKRQRAMFPGARTADQLGAQRLGAVAQLHAIHAGAAAMQVGAPDRDALGPQIRARAHQDLPGPGVLVEHVQRVAPAVEPDPAALADGEAVLTEVAAEHVPVAVDERAGAVAQAAVARQEARAVGPGQEAQVLGVRLAGDREAGLGG